MDIKKEKTKQEIMNGLQLEAAILKADIHTALQEKDLCFPLSQSVLDLKALETTIKDLYLNNTDALPVWINARLKA